MDTTPFWKEGVVLPTFPRIDRNLKADVVVVGAGLTGATTAYLLKKAGKKVVLLDRDEVGGVDSPHTTAHLTCVTDKRLHALEKHFGEDHARAVWDAGVAAIDRIQANIRAENIECEFRWVNTYLHTPLKSERDVNLDELKEEAALARKLGFAAAFLDSVPFINRPGVRYAHQAKFHPLKYIAALLTKIHGDGSFVFEKSPADKFSEKPNSVTSGKYRIDCEHIVIATHNPLMGNTGTVAATLLQTKLALYSSYVVGGKIPKGSVPEASYWDTDDPYFYLRIEGYPDNDYAILGGCDHKTGQEKKTEEPYAEVEAMFQQLLPAGRVDHRWSGQVIASNDGLPLIGETADKQYVSTGYCGNGMTFGTLGAMMITEAISGIRNPWRDLFDVHRKKIIGGTWDYLTENKDYPYYLVRDHLAKAETDRSEDIQAGQGKILKLNGKKVAAYRDDKGKLTTCSPVCPHMGCIVGWNNTELTWDCPCHGSRFKPTGEVMSGPAEEPLKPVEM